MQPSDLLRYALWLAAAGVARANRRHYRMPTTWAPHLALNTAALLLPDVLRWLDRSPRQGAPGPVRAALEQVVARNPGYVLCVAPFTAGYLASHPRFDIYKGPLGALRLAGFGLDVLPHGATALGLTLLAGDALAAADAAGGGRGRLGGALRWCARRRALATGAFIALLTLLWESGEWLA
ncbi:MAG TPA: hypothetical protein VNL77_13805, partial [Roseiflexaceae bacterium]|nr:hypothetical protein [Roseiflexaceae bacterium]